ncbi:MAG: BrnA antitoxin family protein [Treponema sp.]|nr:BrnA antitoxin family protein [Treponema sp.]
MDQSHLKKLSKRQKRWRGGPINYTADAPRSTPEVLREFAVLAAERNRRKKKQAVTIRLGPDCLEKYKALGRGYTGIMTDVLNYVADNSEILSKVRGRGKDI